jgi:hypothetical protein
VSSVSAIVSSTDISQEVKMKEKLKTATEPFRGAD